MSKQIIIYENKVKIRHLAQADNNDLIFVGDRVKVGNDEGEVLSVASYFDTDNELLRMLQTISKTEEIPFITEWWRKFKLSTSKEQVSSEIKPGDVIEFRGFNWIVLDPDYNGGVLVIMDEVWKDTPFNDTYDANWKTSTLRKDMIDNLLPILGEENLITHVTDMIADNGDKYLGTCEDKVFILSCDEYRKYRDYIPLFEECMWTCTPRYIDYREGKKGSPYSGYAYHPRYVNSDGSVNYDYAIPAYGAVPACVLNPSICNATRQRREDADNE